VISLSFSYSSSSSSSKVMVEPETFRVFRSSRRNTPRHPSIAGGRKRLLEDEDDDEYENDVGTTLRLASSPSAEQIDRGAQLQQRVIGWLNPVYPRNRIEDDFFLLRGIVFDGSSENHLAQPG
jgi:hypothetical protein